MRDTKREMHDFILKSYKEAIHDFSYRNDELVARGAEIIEKYFFKDAQIRCLSDEFKMTEANVSNIINSYLEHLSDVAKHGGYISDEINLIDTLLSARRSARKAYKECVEVIDQCKKEFKPEVVFSTSDHIEKLYDLNIISKRTLNSLYAEFKLSPHPSHNPDITLASIAYVPKTWFYHIPNMGAKSIAEVISFVDKYPIQGRVIPTKKDIRQVLKKVNIENIEEDKRAIINAYYLTDVSVDTMCKHLKTNSRSIHTFIGSLLLKVCEAACENKWELSDLITVSSMIDLYSVRRGTYSFDAFNKYNRYTADKIRDI